LRRQQAKQFLDVIQGGYWISQGHRKSPAPKKRGQGVLVVTTLNDRSSGQKNPARQSIGKLGNCHNILIVVGHEQINSLSLYDLTQGARESQLRRRRNPVITIGVRFLEDKPIIMATDDEQ
jgi:hypothetical protein